MKLGQHIAHIEGERANTTFEGTLEEAKVEIKKLRRLMQHIRRTNIVFEVFQKIDSDHNNFITVEEMQQWLSKYKKKIQKSGAEKDEKRSPHCPSLRYTVSIQSVEEAKEEAKRIFSHADYTYDHVLDFHEFYEFVTQLFHASFDRLDTEGTGIIDSTHFETLLRFIYGEELGVKDNMGMTEQGKAYAIRRKMRAKIMEMKAELKSQPITRGLFIDYLMHCFEAHHCSDLYYNLMHLCLFDGADWATSMQESKVDVATELSIEKADAEIADVERVAYKSQKTKRNIEDAILEGACASPVAKSVKAREEGSAGLS